MGARTIFARQDARISSSPIQTDISRRENHRSVKKRCRRHDLHVPHASRNPPGWTEILPPLRHGSGTAGGGRRLWPQPRARRYVATVLGWPCSYDSSGRSGDGRPLPRSRPIHRPADVELAATRLCYSRRGVGGRSLLSTWLAVGGARRGEGRRQAARAPRRESSSRRTIVEGRGTIDESMVTGESMPVDKAVGAKVIGGTVNGTGGFFMRAERIGRDTMLARIVQMVAEAQRSRAPIQRLADRMSGWFVPLRHHGILRHLGKGVIGEVEGRRVLLGNAKFLRESNIDSSGRRPR
jgi:E1-E2 ATPase